MSTPGSSALPVGRAFAVVAAGVVGLLAGTLLGAALRQAGAPIGVRTVLMLSQAMLALPAIVVLRRARVDAVGRPLSPGNVVAAMFAGFCLWVAGLGLLQVQQNLWPPPPGYLEAFQRLHAQLKPRGPLEAIASVAAIALAPAICEEIVFRGALLSALWRRFGAAVALVVSALVFGLMHVDSTGGGAVLYRVPFAIGIGLGLGALRVWSGSLLASSLAHGTLNTLTFAVVAVGAQEAEETRLPIAFGLSMLAAGAALAALAVRRTAPPATLDG